MSTTAEMIGGRCLSIPIPGLLVGGYDFDVPSTLGESEKSFIFDGLFPVGLDAFEKDASPDFEVDVRNHLFSCDHLIVLRADGTLSASEKVVPIGAPRPLAFLVWKTYDSAFGKALLISGVCVKAKWQGHGFGNKLIRYAMDAVNPDIVFLTTQNPVMKQSFDRAIGKQSYPWQLGEAWQGESSDAVGEELASLIGKSEIYDSRTHLLHKNYGCSLYKTQPRSKNSYYNTLFDQINYHEGDAYLCYAIVDK